MSVAPPPTDPMEIAKGGLWSGPFNSIDVDPNTRALLLDLRWTTTDGGSVPASRIPYAFPTQTSDFTETLPASRDVGSAAIPSTRCRS